jgi:molybdenum cofactor biosynthesis enzyme MoaA
VNDDEVADFVEMTRDRPINVRFIEYMPFDGNVWSTGKMVPYREVMQRINDRCAAAPVAEACGQYISRRPTYVLFVAFHDVLSI